MKSKQRWQLWCNSYHYCTTSFISPNIKFQTSSRFKSNLRRVRDSQWWECLTMIAAGNKAKRLSLVNHTTKTIHQYTQKLLIGPELEHFYTKLGLKPCAPCSWNSLKGYFWNIAIMSAPLILGGNFKFLNTF